MSIVTQIIWPVFAGALLGLFFFGGLKWTVERLPESDRPHVLFLSSFVVRMAVVVVGFLLVGGSVWRQYVFALAGFVAARVFVLWRYGSTRNVPEEDTTV